MDKWLRDILPDKDPYHNRRRDQMRKKGGSEFECLWFWLPLWYLQTFLSVSPNRFLDNLSQLRGQATIIIKTKHTIQPINNCVIIIKRSLKIPKETIRIRKPKKNRQHNDQKKVQKDKQRSTKHTHKTKDRVTRTH